MFFSGQSTSATTEALHRSLAVIEFDPDGTILTANAKFLDTVGYALSEIQGRHHRMFVDPAERESAAYREFWSVLARGEFKAAEFKRVAKGEREIWLQATYSPVLDRAGRAFKVVKVATDITGQKLQNLDLRGKFAALDRSRAVIEFDLDGTILVANQNFLDTVGYTLDEIVGQHHSLFVDAAERQSDGYRSFWEGAGPGRISARGVQAPRQGRTRDLAAGDPTTRSSTTRASRSRWSSSPTTSRPRSCAWPTSWARSLRSAARRP